VSEGVHGIREVERNAGGRGNREVRGYALQRLLGGHTHDGLAILLQDIESLDAVRLGERRACSREPQHERVQSS